VAAVSNWRCQPVCKTTGALTLQRQWLDSFHWAVPISPWVCRKTFRTLPVQLLAGYFLTLLANSLSKYQLVTRCAAVSLSAALRSAGSRPTINAYNTALRSPFAPGGSKVVSMAVGARIVRLPVSTAQIQANAHIPAKSASLTALGRLIRDQSLPAIKPSGKCRSGNIK